MLLFIVRRIAHGLLIMLAVSFLTFFLINQSPGDYLDRLRHDPLVPDQYVQELEQRLQLDKPWIVSYGNWLWGIVTRLDFGTRFEYKRPVFDVLADRALNTLILSMMAILFAWVLAVPMGILAGARQYSLYDKAVSALAFIWVSIPPVFLALLAVYFAAQTDWFPTGGLHDQVRFDTMNAWDRFSDALHHLVLPTFVLGSGALAYYMRQMRGSLLDVLRADYVRTARAKGLSESTVLFKHAVRNAINPLITLFGFSLSGLLSGSVLVEQVMSYPGLGRMTVQALFNKDLYLVMAAVLTSAALLVVGNLVADILLAWSDPRIKLEDALER